MVSFLINSNRLWTQSNYVSFSELFYIDPCEEMVSSEDLGYNAIKFCKLNSSNYRTWAFNMKLYLENQDLFDHADGTAIAPGSSASETQRNAFKRAAKKAWTSICLAVEPA